MPLPILSRTPSFSLPFLPCATAQGWILTHLDNARKFNLKFTVDDLLSTVWKYDTPPSREEAVEDGGLPHLDAVVVNGLHHEAAGAEARQDQRHLVLGDVASPEVGPGGALPLYAEHRLAFLQVDGDPGAAVVAHVHLHQELAGPFVKAGEQHRHVALQLDWRRVVAVDGDGDVLHPA